MSEQWIKLVKGIHNKPEIWEMAEGLNLTPDEVVGKFIRVLFWFDDNSENGNAPSVTEKIIDDFCGENFAKFLKITGWISENNGEISLRNFERHNGKTAKKRAMTASRQKNYRNANVTQAASPDKRREDKSIYSENFLFLWKKFPVIFGAKGSKSEAAKEFKKLNPSDELFQEILSGLSRQVDHKTHCQSSGEFCERFQHVERWIKKRRWEDETPESETAEEWGV